MKKMYPSFKSALLGLMCSISISCLVLAIYGIPWSIHWRVLILLFVVFSFLIPLYFGLPQRAEKLISYGAFSFVVVSSLVTGGVVYFHHSVPPLPAFTLDFEYPTQDKSQSKIWYSHNAWWAWLPDKNASTLWRRDSQGEWLQVKNVGRAFDNIAGLADVWPENDYVAAVVYTSSRLTFARLGYSDSNKNYMVDGLIQEWVYKEDPTVTNATIARDQAGIWWISYTQGRTVWIVSSRDSGGRAWHAPNALAYDISKLDKSIVFPVIGGIGVMWGVQRENNAEESVQFIMHKTGRSHDQWEDLEILRSGVDVGEDHFNAARASNGDVYVSTMDDANALGEPLLIMWVRTESGDWEKMPYGTLTKLSKPSRAVVLFREEKDQYFVTHNRLNSGKNVYHDIVYRCASQAQKSLSEDYHSLIARPGVNITDPTSTKQHLPENDDWIVLASDSKGRIYEGKLRECVDVTTGMQSTQ